MIILREEEGCIAGRWRGLILVGEREKKATEEGQASWWIWCGGYGVGGGGVVR
jgi:hypothetical protein